MNQANLNDLMCGIIGRTWGQFLHGHADGKNYTYNSADCWVTALEIFFTIVSLLGFRSQVRTRVVIWTKFFFFYSDSMAKLLQFN